MINKPSIPQGTRDFSADIIRKRNYILSTIKTVFELYGFQPLETPAMENLETLMGKYGEEGDKLIFKILNNGINNEKNIDKAKAGFEKVLEGKSSSDLTERALKYDLTIPFARYVAMNHTKLTFPFRRYQMQPVWRADRPQKGRYREFTQCDADVVGSKSLLNEAELTNIYATVFSTLKIDVEIKINNRKILTGIAESIGELDRIIDITVAIDKLDKIGVDGVKEELLNRGFSQEKVKKLNEFILLQEDKIVDLSPHKIEDENLRKLNFLKNGSDYRGSAILQKGVKELEELINSTNSLNISNIKVDFTLARGLNYYTGVIFEVKAKNVQMGSIGGGGRYDDLTGLFGVPNIPGIGISFGVDRIYDVLEEMNLFPADLQISTKALFFNMGEAESHFAFGIMQQLRNSGIASELYHETTKINKQFSYAEKKNIPYAVIIGSKEIEQNYCQVKNLVTSEQQVVLFDNLVSFFKDK
jgi:histidyl-tRNA synthetase